MSFARLSEIVVLVLHCIVLFSSAVRSVYADSIDDAPSRRFNVLFIAIDDLRPALACYGDPVAITPNMDRLAKRGTLFSRAYCQQAVCSPSRLSLLTGRRPDTIQVWDLKTHFRQAIPNVVTLPQHFRDNGYFTQSIGKIYHGSGAPSKDPPSWSVEPKYDYVRDPALRYSSPENLSGSGLKRSAAESADVSDDAYTDGLVCNEAINALRGFASKAQAHSDASTDPDAPDASDPPFFLAVGFRKPHLPFCAPSKYWEQYRRDNIPLPQITNHPLDAPEFATRSWQELEGYKDIPKDAALSEAKVRELRHGYYACVSYIDAQVGKLLDALEALQLERKTVIVLWSDHGFHLGEQGLWTKANNYEQATRVPLILSVPDYTTNSVCDQFVELVDLYPTLAEVCKLEIPPGLEGASFAPLLMDPSLPWKSAAFSQFPRGYKSKRHSGHGDVMGYTIRTEEFRYVEWRDWKTQSPVAKELYHLVTDPLESKNVASDPNFNSAVNSLSELLRAGWRTAVAD